MNGMQTQMYVETPTRTISDRGKTQGKQDISAQASAGDKRTQKKNFKQLVDEIGEAAANMEQLANDVLPGDIVTEDQQDNSRYGNLCKDDIANVAGTLEGFELLENQEGNQTVTVPEILEGGTTQTMAVATDGLSHPEGTPMSTMMAQDGASKKEAGSELPEQLAGMRKDEPINAGTKMMTQQEILDKVETYLCSLESTNKDATTKSKATDMPTAALQNQTESPENKGAKASPMASVESLNEKEAEAAAKPSNNQPMMNVGQSSQTLVEQEGALQGTLDVAEPSMARSSETFSEDNVTNIVDQICITSAEDKQSFDIKLKPDRLGSVNIKLAMQNGSIKVEIKAQDASVKGLIADQLPALQTLMEQKGLTVSNIEVSCETQSFLQQEGQMPNQNNSSNQSKNPWRVTTATESAENTAGYDADSGWVGLYGDTSSVVFLA